MHGQTIHPSAIGKQFRLINRFRRNNQAHKATFAAGLGRQGVITASQLGQLNPKRIAVARIQSQGLTFICFINQYDRFRAMKFRRHL